MVVEIKSTDSAEEIDRKLQAIKNESARKQKEAEAARIEQLMKYFGSIKSDADPLALQKQWRNDWE
jgi:hypothetical protein